MRVIGVLLVVLLFGPVVTVRAQLPPIEVQKLRPKLFLVTGANANTVVFVRSTDVVVIVTASCHSRGRANCYRGKASGGNRRVAGTFTAAGVRNLFIPLR